jgi:hypothetical protein
VGVEEVAVQAALQRGLKMWLFRLLFSEAEDVAFQAALQWGLMRWLFRLLFSGA